MARLGSLNRPNPMQAAQPAPAAQPAMQAPRPTAIAKTPAQPGIGAASAQPAAQNAANAQQAQAQAMSRPAAAPAAQPLSRDPMAAANQYARRVAPALDAQVNANQAASQQANLAAMAQSSQAARAPQTTAPQALGDGQGTGQMLAQVAPAGQMAGIGGSPSAAALENLRRMQAQQQLQEQAAGRLV